MKDRVIAVEDSLSPVRDALQARGHQVVSMAGGQLPQADVMVLTGGDENMMGMMDTTTEAQIIVAEGMTAEDVVNAVEEKLGRRP